MVRINDDNFANSDNFTATDSPPVRLVTEDADRPEVHCPFINRNDARCARHFAVVRLADAFAHCFSNFADCPNYRELLLERTTTGFPRSVQDDHLQETGGEIQNSSKISPAGRTHRFIQRKTAGLKGVGIQEDQPCFEFVALKIGGRETEKSHEFEFERAYRDSFRRASA